MTPEIAAKFEQSRIFYAQWEMDVLMWFQSIHNKALDFFFSNITKLGDSGIFWIIITALMIAIPFVFKKKGWSMKIGWTSFVALFFSVLICNIILKTTVMRARPAWIDDSVKMLVSMPDDYSFPSGHSSASFASATAIFMNNKKWGIAALVLAALIAISRLYLYVHWPTDVIVGTVTGIIEGVVAYYIVNYVYKKRANKLTAKEN